MSEKFTEVSEYISQHYQEDLSVAELAEKISYELFIFCRNIQGVLWADLQGDGSHGKTAKSGGLIAIHRF